MVDIIQPEPRKRFMDPACGTGGFLYAVIRRILKDKHKDNVTDSIKNELIENINGIEINPSVAEVATLRLILEGGNGKNILCTNSLNEFEEISILSRLN